MGFIGNELSKAVDFLNLQHQTGLFITFLLLSGIFSFLSIGFASLFVGNPMSAKLIR